MQEAAEDLMAETSIISTIGCWPSSVCSEVLSREGRERSPFACRPYPRRAMLAIASR
jgi:hypothetical protein